MVLEKYFLKDKVFKILFKYKIKLIVFPKNKLKNLNNLLFRTNKYKNKIIKNLFIKKSMNNKCNKLAKIIFNYNSQMFKNLI
jgi:hypothetical protein